MATKTLRLTVYLWTNDIPAPAPGESLTVWDSGCVYIPSQPEKALKDGNQVLFNSMAELPEAVRNVLQQAGVALKAGG